LYGGILFCRLIKVKVAVCFQTPEDPVFRVFLNNRRPPFISQVTPTIIINISSTSATTRVAHMGCACVARKDAGWAERERRQYAILLLSVTSVTREKPDEKEKEDEHLFFS
jgi:hypothetical protein